MKVVQRINTVLHLRGILPKPYTAAVILAGGSGVRMGSSTPKQLMMLCGKPVFIHTALAFQKCRLIDEIVLVVREEEVAAVKILCQRYGIKKCRAVVTGGETRQESAEHGFEAVSPKAVYVAFHDAARCMVTPSQIRDVALAAYAYRAASAGMRVTDTVKLVNQYGFIEKTVPREDVWLASTPQFFHKAYYGAAIKMAKEKNLDFTDDNALMELIGQRVKMVDTGNENFKITVSGDLDRAELILRRRAEVRHGK
jgi:2-C-methyl-D-erythritol 4-phosphate cytidylyltransferase